MLLTRVCLLEVTLACLLLFPALSIQHMSPRAIIGGMRDPTKDVVVIFATTNTTSTTTTTTTTSEPDTTRSYTTDRTSEHSITPTSESMEMEAVGPVMMESKEKVEQSRPQDSLATTLLMDIRDVLKKKSDTRKDETFRTSVEHRLEALALKVQDSVDVMASDLEKMRENMEQKVNLMLETFSTLRLLVVGQSEQLSEVRERLQVVEGQAKRFQEQIETTQKSVSDCQAQTMQIVDIEDMENGSRGKTNSDTENGASDLKEAVRNTTTKLEDLTLHVKTITVEVHEVKDKLNDIQTKVANLSAASSETITSKDVSSTTPSSMSCQCSTEELQDTVDKLKEAQKKQETEFVEVKRRIAVVENLRSAMASYSQRVGEVESPLQALEDVKTTVAAVQDDLNKLKEGIEGAVVTNGTFFTNITGVAKTKGMCVWPYTRGGGSCYFVNVEDRLGWEAAREHCRSLQGDLAAPHSFSRFKAFIQMQRVSRAYTYWMGATNTEPKGEWRWTDGREVEEVVWGADPPPTGRAPRCMALKPAYRFGATADSCRESKFFICEQERLL